MNASILKRASVAIAATAAAWIFAMPMPARASDVHLADFQLDGDAKEATCGGAFGALSCPTAQPDDWDSLYSCPSSGTNLCSKIPPGSTTNLADVIADMVDEFNRPDLDNFGQGTKDDMNVTAWNWTAASGSAKTNIMQSFAAKYDGNLYIGGNRDINNGDANFGVWLLQNATVECNAAMVAANQCASAGTFVGKPNASGFRSLVPHKIGDILIVSAFTNGGTVANIQVYKVIQSLGSNGLPNAGDNAVPGTCPATAFDGYAGKSTGSTGICLQQLITQTTPGVGACNSPIGTIPADAACAATNAGGVPALDPRFLSSQSGSVKGQYPALTFFEVGLNLVDLNLTTECFPNYIVAGRQSQSVTAALNDFTLGSFQSCDAGIKTQASGPVTVGATVTDTATLAGTNGGPTPTGTVTFNAYSDSTCTTQVFTSTKTVSGFADYTSDPYTTTAAGTIYWIASYTGDSNFPAATGACGDANESSVVNKASPGITTNATAGPVIIGATIHDTATLSGGFSPTGTVTFSLYGPGDTTCSSTVISTSTVSVVSGTATSGNYTTAAAGTYRWIAVYNGDSNNNTATTACNDANEASVVAKNSPGLSTAPTVKVIHSDSATLSGGSNPTGSLTFNLYQNATCTGIPVFTATKTVAGNGTYASGDSAQFTVSIDTTFSWLVAYTGDANNNGKSSACGDEKVLIDITP